MIPDFNIAKYTGNQGPIGALQQYWDVEEKARLYRKNTFFEDTVLSNVEALKLATVFIVLALAIVVVCLIGGSLV